MAVCTPTTAVQGQGSINVAYLRQESQQVTTAYGERTNLADIYAFTASPATGWAFDHFEIVTTYDFGSYVETPGETHTIETSSSPSPITDNPFQTVGLATQRIANYLSIGEYYGTGRYRSTYKTLTYTVTAVFVQAPTTYTITLVAHNGWGNVCFEGETPATTVQKTVASGTSLRIEAIRVGLGPIPHLWRLPSGGSRVATSMTINPTADGTWTAYFYYAVHFYAARESDPTSPANVGEIRAVDEDGRTPWATEYTAQVYNGSRVAFEQRALSGWTFVKWRFRPSSSTSWEESTNETLDIFLIHLEVVAVFRRVPTNLLVNSSTLSTPVRLVYDPATNLLVADF